jgi:GxxExxY protein
VQKEHREIQNIMIDNNLTEKVIGICIKIHRTLGPGLLESVYEDALCYELEKATISYKRQQEIYAEYDGVRLGVAFRADVIVEGRLIIELKSVEAVAKIHSKILLTYMRLTGVELGLLINFNEALLKDGIVRLIDDKWQQVHKSSTNN